MLAALACVLAGAWLAGCGLVSGPNTDAVNLLVTENFGATKVAEVPASKAAASESVMGLLERSFPVQTGPGGAVTSIDGRSADGSRSWSYYVNGVQVQSTVASTRVHGGDRIWWDLHGGQAASIAAVVGSFPEPFVHGIGGKRYPTTLECGPDVTEACRVVSAALRRAGVTAATQLFGTGSGTDSLNVVVATWGALRSALVADIISRGPSVSGVYARFAGGQAARLELLDSSGRVARTLGPGAGLIAATADVSHTPIWLITGTDPRGVTGAAAALTPAYLRDHFALALGGGRYVPLPLNGAG